MNYQDKELAQGRWFQFAFIEQMAHIGGEVNRVVSWREKNRACSINAVERALELIDLTITDPKNKRRLKEFLRLREVLVDYFYFDNQDRSSDKLWQNYFYQFFYAARKEK
ncbi:MAG: hypothetical protein ABIL40_10245 [candidate division WOR-3 bacterium]